MTWEVMMKVLATFTKENKRFSCAAFYKDVVGCTIQEAIEVVSEIWTLRSKPPAIKLGVHLRRKSEFKGKIGSYKSLMFISEQVIQEFALRDATPLEHNDEDIQRLIKKRKARQDESNKTN